MSRADPDEDDEERGEANEEDESEDAGGGGETGREGEKANRSIFVVPLKSQSKSSEKQDLPLSTVMRAIDGLPTNKEAQQVDTDKSKDTFVVLPSGGDMQDVAQAADTNTDKEAGLPLASLRRAIDGLPTEHPGPGAYASLPSGPPRPDPPAVTPDEPDPAPSTPTVHDSVLVTPDDRAETAQVRLSNTPEVVEGRRLEERAENQPESKQNGWCFLLWLFAGCILALVLFFVFKSDSPSTPDDQETIPCHLYIPFQEGLSPFLTKLMQDPSHPYCLANKWVLEDPKLDSYSTEQQRQRFDLVSFYHHLNGTNWHRNDHWLSYDVPECHWWSQTAKEHNQYDDYPVCDEDGTMLKLNLNSNNLQGTAPNVQGGMLPRVRSWDIGNNKIEGPFLPTHMPDLEVYVVNNNRFEGPMIAYGGYSQFKVRIIRFDGNKFTGDNYGPLFTLMPDLEVFNVTVNEFGGRISENYGLYCKKMKHFWFSKNNEVGPIPSEMGLLSDLVELDVSDNIGVNETIPTELGQLTNLRLLRIDGTSVHGPVPEPLCDRIRNGALDFRANCSLVDCCQ